MYYSEDDNYFNNGYDEGDFYDEPDYWDESYSGDFYDYDDEPQNWRGSTGYQYRQYYPNNNADFDEYDDNVYNDDDGLSDLDSIADDYTPYGSFDQRVGGAIPRTSVRITMRDQRPVFRGGQSNPAVFQDSAGLYSQRIFNRNHVGGPSKPFVYLPNADGKRKGLGGVMFVPQRRSKSVDFITWNNKPIQGNRNVSAKPERPFITWLEQKKKQDPGFTNRISKVDMRINGTSCKHCAKGVKNSIASIVGPRANVNVRVQGPKTKAISSQTGAKRPGIRRVVLNGSGIPSGVRTPLSTVKNASARHIPKVEQRTSPRKYVTPSQNTTSGRTDLRNRPNSDLRNQTFSKQIPKPRNLAFATPSTKPKASVIQKNASGSGGSRRPANTGTFDRNQNARSTLTSGRQVTRLVKPRHIDRISSDELNKGSFIEGSEKLKAAGLVSVKSQDGSIDFIQNQNGKKIIRARWIPQKGRQPQQWLMFSQNEGPNQKPNQSLSQRPIAGNVRPGAHGAGRQRVVTNSTNSRLVQPSKLRKEFF
ncbi:MAG: hypothetical protein J7604_19380 [Sporocytophaga sp.]|uniref:hypothetical protein n=1 Tax=Sporocytophaga sp. TaxID=2231183 RepID=UPI001B1CCB88|nr:hypothetical protein [Sporocytophaga sp.]MBO9702381.1 hypothetical protein [Sporocytophaga sp.]